MWFLQSRVLMCNYTSTEWNEMFFELHIVHFVVHITQGIKCNPKRRCRFVTKSLTCIYVSQFLFVVLVYICLCLLVKLNILAG